MSDNNNKNSWVDNIKIILSVATTLGLFWLSFDYIKEAEFNNWVDSTLVFIIILFAIIILAAGIEKFAKLIEKYIFIKIANFLYDLRQNKQKSIKASKWTTILSKTIIHQMFVFITVVSITLCWFSGNLEYMYIIPAYIIFGFLFNYSVKYSDSHTDNHFQNTENLYFEIVAFCCLTLSGILIPSSDNVFDNYWKIVPDFNVNSAYEPDINNSIVNRSNAFLTVPNMEFYTPSQLKKINFNRFINDTSLCNNNGCKLEIVGARDSQNKQIENTLKEILANKRLEEKELIKGLNKATDDKQYFYLETNGKRSNIFWVENHIVSPEYWILLIATLSTLLILIGSIVKIFLIFNARRSENSAEFYASKIFNTLRYADSYHAYIKGGIQEIIKPEIKENICDYKNLSSLSVRDKENAINGIKKHLKDEFKSLKETLQEMGELYKKNNKDNKPYRKLDNSVVVEIIHNTCTELQGNDCYTIGRVVSKLQEEEKSSLLKEVEFELVSLAEKIFLYEAEPESNVKPETAFYSFVLYTIQDVFLPRYEKLSSDYINQNLLPYSYAHRQIVDVDFRECNRNSESLTSGLHAGSLVDIDPHARLIKFIIDAVIYTLISYLLIVLYTHQWLPTEAAVISSMAAAIMYLNRDWLNNLIAGYIIWRDELISLGEWIKIPEDNINGHVVDITQSNFKIANYSGTHVSMPIHEIINKPFQSFKKAKEKGHRIKRSFLIDIRSIRPITISSIIGADDSTVNDELNPISIRDKIKEAYDHRNTIDKSKLLDDKDPKINKTMYSNLELFRKYMTEYLLDKAYINNNELLMVRELDLTEHGIPLEIYAFVEPMLAVYTDGENKNKCIRHYDRVVYEAIQSEIIEHAISASKVFGLRIFQSESDRQDEGVDTLDKQ
jgi:hypothetical protein